MATALASRASGALTAAHNAREAFCSGHCPPDMMAAADPATAAKKASMAPSMASAVPTGTAPIVPTFVAPAQTYEDDEDEVEDIMRPKAAPLAQGASGLNLGLIFGVALLVITLSAVATFYALDMVKTSTTGAPATPASTLKPADAATTNETVPTEAVPPVEGALDHTEGDDAVTYRVAEGTPRSPPKR